MVAFFTAACDDLAFSFYIPWTTRADMESAARHFQVFNALLLRCSHATTRCFASIQLWGLAIYALEAWRISTEGGMIGPTYSKARRVQMIAVALAFMLPTIIG